MVKTIVHHLGLGDQIMLNGMVRHFAETDNVVIFVKRCHEESVRFMYRDIADKVELILVDNTNAQEIWSKVKGDVIPLATYGIDDNGWKFMTQGQGSVMTNWAHGVYIQAGINPKYMYSKFKVDRDKSKEFKIDKENYIFVHDDPERDRNITLTDSDKYIYKPHSKLRIFGCY
jgi:lipoate-protein ligase A